MPVHVSIGPLELPGNGRGTISCQESKDILEATGCKCVVRKHNWRRRMLIVYGPCDRIDEAVAMANEVIIASQANRAAADDDDQPMPRNRRALPAASLPAASSTGMPAGLPAASSTGMPMNMMNAGFGFPLPAQTALHQPLHFVQLQLQQMQMIAGIAIQQQLQQQHLLQQVQYPQALHMSRVSPIAFAPHASNAVAEASSNSSNSDSSSDEMDAGHEELASNVADPPTPAAARVRVLTPHRRPEVVASDPLPRPFPKMITMEGTTTAAKAKDKPSQPRLLVSRKKRRAASEGAKPVAVAKDECPSPPVQIRAQPSGSATSAPVAAVVAPAEDRLDLVGHSAGTLGDDKRKESAPVRFSCSALGGSCRAAIGTRILQAYFASSLPSWRTVGRR